MLGIITYKVCGSKNSKKTLNTRYNIYAYFTFFYFIVDINTNKTVFQTKSISYRTPSLSDFISITLDKLFS